MTKLLGLSVLTLGIAVAVSSCGSKPGAAEAKFAAAGIAGMGGALSQQRGFFEAQMKQIRESDRKAPPASECETKSDQTTDKFSLTTTCTDTVSTKAFKISGVTFKVTCTSKTDAADKFDVSLGDISFAQINDYSGVDATTGKGTLKSSGEVSIKINNDVLAGKITQTTTLSRAESIDCSAADAITLTWNGNALDCATFKTASDDIAAKYTCAASAAGVR